MACAGPAAEGNRSRTGDAVLRLGFDVDGVLADFDHGYAPRIVQVSNRNLFPPEGVVDPPCWHWPQHWGYTNAEVNATWDAIKQDPEFWYRLNELPGAAVLRENWRKLLGAGHDVVFATARLGIQPELQTAAWLRNIGVTYTDVTVTSHKGQFCLDRYVDCYVDDRLENVQDIVKTSPATRTYLLNRAHNAVPADTGYTRVPSVEAFFIAEGLL